MADETVSLARLLGADVSSGTLLERLRSVVDPELGVDIVGLGLVYDARTVDGVARILMTTTTPACPIGSYLSDAIRWTLLQEPGVLDVEVEVTHDPPWSPERMSDEAKIELGWLR